MAGETSLQLTIPNIFLLCELVLGIEGKLQYLQHPLTASSTYLSPITSPSRDASGKTEDQDKMARESYMCS